MTLAPAGGDSGSSRSLKRALDPLLRGPATGIDVGPWVLEAELGRGAMGAVFRARHAREPGRRAALKVLLAGAEASPIQRQRLVREIEALTRLHHPHLVRILDAGESEGYPWIAMELIEGRTLAELPRPRAREAVRLVAQAARGLGQAHARGVVHRDVKPQNIMVRADGDAVVTDFGLARAEGLTALTVPGAVLGTPGYMSPEQALGQPVTARSDVHALGTVLYQLLTGRLPWPADSLQQLLHAHQHERPVPPGQLVPDVDEALEAIVLRALEPDPTRRHADAGALADDLDSWLAGRAAPAGRGPLWLASGLVLVAALCCALLSIPPAPPPPAAPTTADPRGADPAPAGGVQRLRIQPGPLLGKDTTVRCDGLYVNDNFGPANLLKVGDRDDPYNRGDFRALLELPLPRLPAGARLTRARLGLWVHGAGSARPLGLLAWRVVASPGGRTPWVEGTGLYDLELDGVCWDGDAPDPRAGGTRGSGRPDLTQPDVDPEPVARLEVAPLAGAEAVLDVTAAVRAWLEGAPNFGLRLSHEPEGEPYGDGIWTFGSSDHAVPARRPWLELEWEGRPLSGGPPPEPDAAAAHAQARTLLARAEALPPDQARPSLCEAARVAPDLGQVYLARARQALATGHPHVARLDLVVAPTVAQPAPLPEGLLLRGEAWYMEEDAAQAREALERALSGTEGELSPALALRARAFLGVVLQAQRHSQEVVRWLEPVEDVPDLPWIGQWALGHARLSLARLPEAELALRRAVAAERAAPLYPGQRAGEPCLDLARLLLQRGREEEARATLREGLESGIADPRLEQLLRELERRARGR